MSWKKKLVCDISGKKLFVFDQREKNVMFSCWGGKNYLIRKKNHTPPLVVLNGSPLNYFIGLCRMIVGSLRNREVVC